jgi:hypothetical protein
MFTFIELPAFSRYRDDYFTEDSFSELQQYLNKSPEAGDLIPNTGGVRKLRWMRAGMGKRGGLRIIYYFQCRKGLIWLLIVYSKSASENISSRTLRALREVADNAEIV